MTAAIEQRADGWKRDYARASAAVQILARQKRQDAETIAVLAEENRALRARVAELEAQGERWRAAVGRLRAGHRAAGAGEQR